MRNFFVALGFLLLIGLNAVGLTSDDTRFASVNDYKARHAEQSKPSGPAERTAKRVQGTRHLCDKPYPDPGGKDDCELAKKLFANPRYIKM